MHELVLTAARPGLSHPGDLTPLTGARVFSTWTLDVPMLAVAVLLAVGYLVGLLRHRRLDQRWPVGRAVAYYGGVLLFALVTMSFLGVYETTLFWDRALQNILLLMVVPFLFAMGAPISLLIATTGQFGQRLLPLIRSRPLRFLTLPVTVSMVLLTAPYVLYLTPLYNVTLTSAPANQLLHVVLPCFGGLYYWSRLRIDPTPREGSHLVSVWISFAEGIADGTLGVIMILGHPIDPTYYHALHRHWGPDFYWDQVWGGGCLWFVGDITSVPFLAALWRRLFREDQEQSEGAEAGLEPIIENETLSRMVDGDETVVATPQRFRPWWETDPVLGPRYGFREPE
jgi:cytochrome c oxidase assembly factor CtaG